MAIITNIEPEHMECYRDLSDLHECFTEFANRVPFFGTVILCTDDPGILKIEPSITRPKITYGLGTQADFRATEISFDNGGINFTLLYKGNEIGKVESPLLGYHNVRNILACFAVAHDLEIPVACAIKAIKSFTGVERRLELAGAVGDIRFYDDYGHHPTEIKTTLQGLRSIYNGRIVAVLQPHLYSRTVRFLKEFGEAFFDADQLVVLDVFPSREKPIAGVSGKLIVDSARKQGHQNVNYVEDKTTLPEFMKEILKPGDLVVLFGAGDINRWTRKIIEKLKE